ncbi:carboxymuconolactone decarboxylase family protein [Edaphobacter aggregans]|uniref:carboxymuconolactone decarboxylase family protein n=1 Tax=Edaphobacter aggregans TaxID=570835 RepID=UPI001B80C3AB
MTAATDRSQSPVALDGYLSLTKALSRGRLSARQREILALAIAQENECQYWLSAHTASSKAVTPSFRKGLYCKWRVLTVNSP